MEIWQRLNVHTLFLPSTAVNLSLYPPLLHLTLKLIILFSPKADAINVPSQPMRLSDYCWCILRPSIRHLMSYQNTVTSY